MTPERREYQRLYYKNRRATDFEWRARENAQKRVRRAKRSAEARAHDAVYAKAYQERTQEKRLPVRIAYMDAS